MLRFSLRTLMLAVAIVGAACGVEVMRRRRVDFLSRAKMHRVSATLWRYGVDHGPGERRPLFIDYHERLNRKYEHAARHPWLPVAPDPPEPE